MSALSRPPFFFIGLNEGARFIRIVPMKITWSKFVYNVICNIPVCFFLCLAAALRASLTIDWANFGINFAVSFTLAMMIGLFVPLTRIGKWFTALFKIDNQTYKGNIKYRLLSTLISSLIFFIVINPTLTILNFLILQNMTIEECFIDWLFNIPLMLVVGFLSSLISDFAAYKVANKIDKDF